MAIAVLFSPKNFFLQVQAGFFLSSAAPVWNMRQKRETDAVPTAHSEVFVFKYG